MGTIIEEVAFLDLTKASEEALKEIKAIRNVAFMAYNKQFEPYMANISFSDIASSVKVEGEISSVNGKMVFTESEANPNQPVHYFVNGVMIFMPEVKAETIEQSVSGINVNGVIYSSETVHGAIRGKIAQNNGTYVTYMADAELEVKNVTLNNDYLRQLKDGTNLAVIGKASVLEDFDDDLLHKKINRLQLLGKAVISQTNKEKLAAHWVHGSDKITVVPAGYTYIREDLHLDSDAVTRYEHGKLFVGGVLTFDNDLTPEEIGAHLEAIETDGTVYCPKRLKPELLKLLDPSVQVIGYTGTLKAVDGEYTIRKSELEYTEGKLTIVVHGVLNIDEAVTPQLLHEKIERVDLFGVVAGNGEQCGVLQTKLKIKNGVVTDSDSSEEASAEEPADGDDKRISRVSHLKL